MRRILLSRFEIKNEFLETKMIKNISDKISFIPFSYDDFKAIKKGDRIEVLAVEFDQGGNRKRGLGDMTRATLERLDEGGFVFELTDQHLYTIAKSKLNKWHALTDKLEFGGYRQYVCYKEV
jgi:hypothetical protein